jgi:hypothetical protein
MTIAALSVSALRVPEAAATPTNQPIEAATTLRHHPIRMPSTRPLIRPIAAIQNGSSSTWAPLISIGITAMYRPSQSAQRD